MSTASFIERHGYVKYPVHGYKPDRPCEVPGCPEYLEQLRHVSFDPGFSAAIRGRQRFVIEHCHIHGWIRGITCQSCNSAISFFLENNESWRGYATHTTIDAELTRREALAREYGIELVRPGYRTFTLNCPECNGHSAPEAVRLPKGTTCPKMNGPDPQIAVIDERYEIALKVLYSAYNERLGQIEASKKLCLSAVQATYASSVQRSKRLKIATVEENASRRENRHQAYDDHRKDVENVHREYSSLKAGAKADFDSRRLKLGSDYESLRDQADPIAALPDRENRPDSDATTHQRPSERPDPNRTRTGSRPRTGAKPEPVADRESCRTRTRWGTGPEPEAIASPDPERSWTPNPKGKGNTNGKRYPTPTGAGTRSDSGSRRGTRTR